jgi:hypothetical protein
MEWVSKKWQLFGVNIVVSNHFKMQLKLFRFSTLFPESSRMLVLMVTCLEDPRIEYQGLFILWIFVGFLNSFSQKSKYLLLERFEFCDLWYSCFPQDVGSSFWLRGCRIAKQGRRGIIEDLL